MPTRQDYLLPESRKVDGPLSLIDVHLAHGSKQHDQVCSVGFKGLLVCDDFQLSASGTELKGQF